MWSAGGADASSPAGASRSAGPRTVTARSSSTAPANRNTTTVSPGRNRSKPPGPAREAPDLAARDVLGLATPISAAGPLPDTRGSPMPNLSSPAAARSATSAQDAPRSPVSRRRSAGTGSRSAGSEPAGTVSVVGSGSPDVQEASSATTTGSATGGLISAPGCPGSGRRA